MRPTITADNSKNLATKALRTIFEGVASSQHYKALYTIQKERNINLHTALKVFFDSSEFLSQVEEFLKDDENYKTVFKSTIINYDSDLEDNYDIPTRNCDFKVNDDDYIVSWFYIEERVEIHCSGSSFYIYKLMIDPKSNVLLRSRGEGDWEEYPEKSDIGEAYKGYIAERELLSDN